MTAYSTQLLSQWAFRHPVPARMAIVCIEIINFLIGLLLGATAWATFISDQPSSASYLQAGLILTIGFVFCIRNVYYSYPGNPRPQFKRHFIYALYIVNFLLYFILGGIAGQRSGIFHPSGSVGGSKEIRYESGAGTLRPTQPDRLTKKQVPVRMSARQNSSLTGARIGYALLFLAGLVLAYGAAVLSCNLSCSGYGFASVMVLLLGTGILAGGFYFLGLAVNKNLKRYRDMSQDERKREKRRFLRTWGGVLIALALFYIVALINNY